MHVNLKRALVAVGLGMLAFIVMSVLTDLTAAFVGGVFGGLAGAVAAWFLIKHEDKVTEAVQRVTDPLRDDKKTFDTAMIKMAKTELHLREYGGDLEIIEAAEAVSDAVRACLEEALERLPPGSSDRHEIVRIPTFHLPEILREFTDLPPDMREERKTEILDALGHLRAKVRTIAERIDQQNDMEFATRKRVVDDKYHQRQL